MGLKLVAIKFSRAATFDIINYAIFKSKATLIATRLKKTKFISNQIEKIAIELA